jgi:hypothetical protein
MKSEILLCALDHFPNHHWRSGQVLAIPQEELKSMEIYKYLILHSFYHSGDHFWSLFPILSVEE